MKPSSLLLTQIWKYLEAVSVSSHTRKMSTRDCQRHWINRQVLDAPAKQSPFKSMAALLCGFDNVHCAPLNFGSTLPTY